MPGAIDGKSLVPLLQQPNTDVHAGVTTLYSINGGYGYHSIYRNIPDFIENADIGRIRQRILEP